LPAKSEDVSDTIILYMGRVEEDKGVLDLFHAFRQLNPRPDLQLRFVGNGSANNKLRQLVRQHRLQDRVEVLGPVEFESVFAHLKQATVVVTPSQSRFPEGFCKSAMEAFYVGTPVIAPNYGPFPYMVKHEENGLLYPPDDVAALTQALQRYLEEDGLRSRLEQGARRWGGIFMKPATTFANAIDRVFSQGQPR
jgi:glycosyltransferase involved in cell wall biosynthesis